MGSEIEREKERGIERGSTEGRKRKWVKENETENQILNKRYHHQMDSCNILLVHCPDLFSDIQGLPNVLQEVSFSYNPSPGYPWGIDVIPITWSGICVSRCFFCQNLLWWGFLSRQVTQMCLTRPGIFQLLHQHFSQSALWNLIQCANSKPWLPFRSGINTFLFASLLILNSSYGYLLLGQCLRQFMVLFKSSHYLLCNAFSFGDAWRSLTFHRIYLSHGST